MNLDINLSQCYRLLYQNVLDTEISIALAYNFFTRVRGTYTPHAMHLQQCLPTTLITGPHFKN
jgi:hypothetical protein